jgi:hypothetical protein
MPALVNSVCAETHEGNAKLRSNNSEVLFLCFLRMDKERVL